MEVHASSLLNCRASHGDTLNFDEYPKREHYSFCHRKPPSLCSRHIRAQIYLCFRLLFFNIFIFAHSSCVRFLLTIFRCTSERDYWTRTSVVIYRAVFAVFCSEPSVCTTYSANTYLRTPTDTRNQLNSFALLRFSLWIFSWHRIECQFIYLYFDFVGFEHIFTDEYCVRTNCVCSNASNSGCEQNKHEIDWLRWHKLVYVCTLCGFDAMFEQI